MIRRPPRSTRKESSAASDVYKRQVYYLNVTQYPFDPVFSIRGLAIMAETVFVADGESGIWDVSKKA